VAIALCGSWRNMTRASRCACCFRFPGTLRSNRLECRSSRESVRDGPIWKVSALRAIRPGWRRLRFAVRWAR
jgi:hypothetical protein